MNIKNLDKKLILYIGVGIGTVVFFLTLLFIIKSISGNKISISKLETKMKEAATEYYKYKPELLPTENGNTTKVTIDELVDSKKLKSLDKLLKDDLTCDGYVKISKNNGFYFYTPYLDCGSDYKTTSLSETITKQENVVSSGNGLYKINDYYLFRGENINNYLKFAGKNWRIIRINSDNTIRIILADKITPVVWDDRYNTEKNYNIGKNNFLVSRIKDTLNSYINNKTFSKNEKAMIVAKNLCIGKRNSESTLNDGSIECSNEFQNQTIGLLQVNEFMLASLEPTCKKTTDHQCENYNYLSSLEGSFWTLTASSENTYRVYKVTSTPIVTNASSSAQPKIVINLSNSINYIKGTGSQKNPYIVK